MDTHDQRGTVRRDTLRDTPELLPHGGPVPAQPHTKRRPPLSSTAPRTAAILAAALALTALAVPSPAARTVHSGVIGQADAPAYSTTLLQQVPTASGSAHTWATSVTSAGNLLAVGTPEEGHGAGAVHVYNRTAAGWEELDVLTGPDAHPQARFGHDVAMDASGTLVVSAPGALGAYVYSPTPDGWDLTGDLSLPKYAQAQDADYFAGYGQAVAISGGTAAVTAPQAGGGSGYVYVFDASSGGSWENAGALVSPTAAQGTGFAASVAIDGVTIAVGAPQEQTAGSAAGAVHLFTNGSGSWDLKQTLTALDAKPGDRFGTAVAFDAGRVVTGAPGTSNGGAGYLFTRASEGTWAQDVKLTAPDAGPGAQVGESVAIEAATVVLGAPGAGSGEAYLFVPVGKSWSAISAPARTGQSAAGWDVTVTGHSVVVLDAGAR